MNANEAIFSRAVDEGAAAGAGGAQYLALVEHEAWIEVLEEGPQQPMVYGWKRVVT